MEWHGASKHAAIPFRCGFCDREVASDTGYVAHSNDRGRRFLIANVRICPRCSQPTYFISDKQVPNVTPGNDVANVPNDVRALYQEARMCIAANAPTAAVLTCRKLLMNIAVAEKASTGQSFLDYVAYLSDKGFVPPNGKHWVDHIRKKGNEANHEITLMTKDDAIELVEFCEMLLKFIFEFPNRVPRPAA